ncbi:sensor domain-containing diguanylate cyclase [Candidimonas sp. SYP-B2681]|uniref:sensor domain-containing diguanylate cyclase n=1 Tax=Candidimonas sp. SYP-B2681 TaxID=2497686 RepID=UPI0013157E4C|nr:sensor domain-containing diguanylate cyclase [Candidimonas sp. SYP-B2681]
MAPARNIVASIQADSTLVLKLQYEIATILARSGNIQAALSEVLNKIASSGGWDIGIAWIVNDGFPSYQCEWHKQSLDVSDFVDESRSASFNEDRGLPGAVLDSAALVWIDDLRKDCRFSSREAALALQLRNAMAFPLCCGGTIYGVIELFRTSINELDRNAHNVFNAISNDVGQFLQARRMYEERLEKSALHDPLTGLANRALLVERGNRALLLAERNGDNIALLSIGLDFFTSINDTYGYEVGDQLLTLFAERLSVTVRASDTVARIESDTFAVLIPRIDQADTALIVAQKISGQMAMPFQLEGLDIVLGMSIGVSRYPQDGLDMPTLLHSAGEALHKAKLAGRSNCVVCSKPE